MKVKLDFLIAFTITTIHLWFWDIFKNTQCHKQMHTFSSLSICRALKRDDSAKCAGKGHRKLSYNQKRNPEGYIW